MSIFRWIKIGLWGSFKFSTINNILLNKIKEIKNKYGTHGVDLRSKLETIEANDSYCF